VATVAPYGSWASPISAERIAHGGISLAEPWLGEGGMTYWLEGRPSEGGRNALVRRDAAGTIADVLPVEFNVRTRVHEYGGGAWLLAGDAIVFSNFADQRLYRLDPDGEPYPITPEPGAPAALRYADGRVTPDGRWIVSVRESHAGETVTNELVILPADGSAAPRTIASGRDFYATPRVSPDGARLAWIEWDHPRMPWDGTELMLADLAPDGTLGEPRHVAGGPEESIWQPNWSPAGELHYVSDRSGWWNLYRAAGAAGEAQAGEPLAPDAAEYGYPHWVFGGSTYVFTPDRNLLAIRVDRAEERLCRVAGGRADPLDLPYTSYSYPYLVSRDGRVVFRASSPTEAPALVELDVATGATTVLRRSVEDPVDPAYVSIPRAIEFPTEGDRTAHGWYYPPRHPDFTAPEGERPPLLVHSHGGPTAHVRAELQMDVVYWTSRGFGVVDVNYGGSTGFGRDYRERLKGTWGVVDTADCIAAARHLAAAEVDPDRLAIRGGSAGGYTTLCALVFSDAFATGASYYGVGDAEALARDTHKFESRYLDGLIGPYPEAAERYRERSPIHHVERLRSPVILFQGLEDAVVPPSQAETMVAALRANGVPHAYLAFEGEQHGFRRAETIVRAHEAELYFYGRILGFEPAGDIPPVPIEGLD
jgi:dipeptidyl aminopeptidase/acylaminoacyl peptidase